MRRSILLFASSALLASAIAQQSPQPNARPRARHLPFGLQGNVHTVMTKIEQLRPDPRKTRPTSDAPHRFLPVQGVIFSPTWISFDENGLLVEQGKVSPDGKFASLTHNDGNTNTSTTTVQLPGRAPEITEHRTTRSAGNSITETYRDGQLIQKSQSTSSGGRHHFEHQTYDTQGRLISEGSSDTESQNNDRGFTTTFHEVGPGQKGAIQDTRTVDHISADQKSVEHSQYDANGNLLCTLRLSGASVVYSYILPEAKTPCYANFNSRQESKSYLFYLYPNGGAGELITDVRTYADRQRSFEPDTFERLDSGGNLVDKLSFRYERDAQGNWTTRVVSVLDPATKDLVEIERDTRTITYYDQQ